MIKIYEDDPVIERVQTIAEECGLRLELGTDFRKFKKICENQTGRPAVKPPFDPDDPASGNLDGFWLACFNDNGMLVQSQAMKIIELKGKSLHNYLSENRTCFPLECSAYDTPRIEVDMSETASEISGRIAYHGELWAPSGDQGYRGSCLVPLLCRLVIRLSLAVQKPEHIVGFMEAHNVLRGLSAKLGYGHMEQGNLVFPMLSSEKTFDVWMVWMAAAEAEFNTRLSPDYFVKMLGVPKPLERAA